MGNHGRNSTFERNTLKMKNYLLSTLLAMLAQPSFAQAVDAESIHYKGLDFYNKKSEILHKLGKPDSITQPD